MRAIRTVQGSKSMSFNRAAFKDVCHRAGFTTRELAYIYGTTRQTIHDWQNKSVPTQLALAAREDKTTEALTAAIRNKVLPLSPMLAKQSRKSRIDVIVKTVMESLKPSGRA